jgi:hypothetical protein
VDCIDLAEDTDWERALVRTLIVAASQQGLVSMELIT